MTTAATPPADSSPTTAPADVLVIFGITGDLAKKMTFRSLYRLERRGLLDCPIIGVARREWSHDELATHARTAIVDGGESIDETVFTRFANRFSMVSGNYDDAKTYERLGKAIDGKHTPVYYLEIPPSLFGPVVDQLAGANLTANARIVIEKPFGHDLASANALNDELRRNLEPSGRSSASTTSSARNPPWTSCSCGSPTRSSSLCGTATASRCVQITMAENFGVEDRGSFYDDVGALRDVVQNHLLQLVGLIASEPPSTADADGLRDKRVEVFKAIPSIEPAHYVRGQYDGYRSIEGVQADSQTETFSALRLEINNWRWAGVPFFIRAGKALPVRATEIRIVFKRPPRLPISTHEPDADELILRIDPKPGADLVIQAKTPGANRTRSVDLSLIFADELGEAPEPYERLLSDAMKGDSSQFTRQDTVVETWRIVEQLLDDPPPVEAYKTGTWGPPGSDKLLAGHPGWREPWLR